MNRNFARPGSRLYSPCLKDVAWPEDAQLIFNFPYICLYFFSFPANRVYPAKYTDKCMEN